MAAQAPALTEFLTAMVWEDQKPRETGTVMLVAEGGGWKAWVHDRDAKRSVWLSASTVLDLLVVVEETLISGAGQWRPDKR